MKILNFTNGLSNKTLQRVSIAIVMIFNISQIYAQNEPKNHQQQAISIDLLMMLGGFEKQDDSWLDNELNISEKKKTKEQRKEEFEYE